MMRLPDAQRTALNAWAKSAYVVFQATPNLPLNGVAPGQSAVIYLGTRVLGQFTIDRTVSVDVHLAAAS